MKRILPLSLLLLLGCAPTVQDRFFPEPKLVFENDAKDTQLNLRLRERGEAPPEMAWQGEVSTAEYFDQAEGLIELGDKMNSPALREMGLAWIRAFYKTDGANLTDVASGPFLNLAAAQIEPLVQSSLNDVLLQMEEVRPVILAHVLALPHALPAHPKPGLEGLLEQAEAFNQRVLAEIPHMNLPPVIEDGFRTELIKTTVPLFAQVRVMLTDLKAVTRLSQALALIEKAVVDFKVEVDPELAKSLKQGHQLSQGLDQLTDAQAGLTVIIDVWNILTPEERKEKVLPASAELYNFLVKQSDKELLCLRTRDCLGGPVDGVIKKLFILPKIEDYGVTQLRKEMNAQTLDYVNSEIAKFAQDFVEKMPQTFAENIDTAWLAKVGRMVAVRNDLQPYVNRVGGVWAKKVLPATDGRVPGFEVARIDLNISNKSPLKILAKANTKTLQGDLAGIGLAANTYLLESAPASDQTGLAAALSQVNKIVALSGYRNTRNKLIPALLAPVNHTDKLLDILNFEEAKDVNLSFRLPDVMPMQDGFMAEPSLNYAKDFSAAGFASQIRGLSQALKFTADWQVSSYDRFLTPIKAQHLTEDATDPALQQTLFPKEMIFALNVGTVSVLLQDIIKNETPVFLLTLEGKPLWANQYGDNSKETAVMAGIVDIKDGVRADIVSSADVAKFILAMSEFIEALEGVENTKSPVLLTKNIHGTLPLEAIINGKKDLRRLIVASSNFLAKKMKSPQDMVYSHFSLKQQSILSTKQADTVTQALVVRALARAYEVTGIDAYKWSAETYYYGMNKRLFNVNKEFYINPDGSELNFPERVSVLRALAAVKPYVSDKSRQQLQSIAKPWLESLSQLR